MIEVCNRYTQQRNLFAVSYFKRKSVDNRFTTRDTINSITS